MPTNEKELRELDAWIATNVMGWKIVKHKLGFKVLRLKGRADRALSDAPFYTRNAADALEVLKRCTDKIGLIDLSKIKCEPFNYCIGATYITGCEAEAPTLELAIVLFARKLFGK